MKKIALLMLFASNLFASGKLSISGNHYLQENRTLPTVGFNSYEDTGLGFFVDSYLGTGVAAKGGQQDVYWWVAKSDIVFPITENLSISGGATLKLIGKDWLGGEDESNLHVRAQYKIW